LEFLHQAGEVKLFWAKAQIFLRGFSPRLESRGDSIKLALPQKGMDAID